MGSTAPPRRRSGADMEKKQVLSGKSQQVKYSNSEADTHGGDALSAWRRLHRSYVDGTPGRLDAGSRHASGAGLGGRTPRTGKAAVNTCCDTVASVATAAARWHAEIGCD